MRRRIYIDPEGDLVDNTQWAPGFDPCHDPPSGAFSVCDTGALYDEELWAKYQRACDEASALRHQVIESLVHEPYDEVEMAAHDAMDWRRAKYDRPVSDRIAEVLLAHAKTRTKP